MSLYWLLTEMEKKIALVLVFLCIDFGFDERLSLLKEGFFYDYSYLCYWFSKEKVLQLRC